MYNFEKFSDPRRRVVSAACGQWLSRATQQENAKTKIYIDAGWRKKELLWTRRVHFNSHTEPFYSITYVVHLYLDLECMWHHYWETSARALPLIVYLFCTCVSRPIGYSALHAYRDAFEIELKNSSSSYHPPSTTHYST